MTGSTTGGEPPPSMGGDGNLKNCSEFGECRCPQCNKFYFDSNTCEIVWRCHGCGTPYDPYTTDPLGPRGYRFTLKRKSLSNPDDEFDYGQVKPRGRIAARNNTRYTMTATNEKCAVPRVYTIDTPPTCDCPRGCTNYSNNAFLGGGFGIAERPRSAATLMTWGFTDNANQFLDVRGYVQTRNKISFTGANASHSFPIKLGALGEYKIQGNNTFVIKKDCKYHYVERFGTVQVVGNPTLGYAEYWFYDVGGVKTEVWWDYGGPREVYASATFRLKAGVSYATPYAPGTFNAPHLVISPPSPNDPVAIGVTPTLQMVGYTTGWIPGDVPIPGPGFYPPDHPIREVIPLFVPWFRIYPLGDLDPRIRSTANRSMKNGASMIPWCETVPPTNSIENPVPWAVNFSNVIGCPPWQPDGNWQWESLEI